MKNSLRMVGEALLLVTQEQALRTINLGQVMHREQVNRKHRTYGEREVLLLNIKNWPRRSIQFKDNKIAMEIDYKLCKSCDFPLFSLQTVCHLRYEYIGVNSNQANLPAETSSVWNNNNDCRDNKNVNNCNNSNNENSNNTSIIINSYGTENFVQ